MFLTPSLRSGKWIIQFDWLPKLLLHSLSVSEWPSSTIFLLYAPTECSGDLFSLIVLELKSIVFIDKESLLPSSGAAFGAEIFPDTLQL